MSRVSVANNAPIIEKSPTGSCILGAFSLVVTLVLGIVFMVVTLAQPASNFGTVAGIQGWQIVNYVIQIIFVGVGLVVGNNMYALYDTQRKRILRSNSAPVYILQSPLSTAIQHGHERGFRLLAFMAIIAASTTIFGTAADILIGYKAVEHSDTYVGAILGPIESLLHSRYSEDAVNDLPNPFLFGTPLLNGLVLSNIASQYNVLEPGSCPSGYLCAGPGVVRRVNEWGGSLYNGSTSQGFPSIPAAYFQHTDQLYPRDQKYKDANTVSVTRKAYATTTNFTCTSQQLFGNYSQIAEVTVGVYPNQDTGKLEPNVNLLYLWSYAFNGTCGQRNVTFLQGSTLYSPPFFDVVSCNSTASGRENFINIDILVAGGVLSNDLNYATLQTCSGTIDEYQATGIQTSDNVLSITQNGPATSLNISSLNQYVDIINDYVTVQPSNFQPETSRSQRGWISVLEYNYPTGSTGSPYMSPDFFSPVYCNALIASIGTMFSSADQTYLFLGGDPATSDTIKRDVIRLGAPLAIGIPICVCIGILLILHAWLYYHLRHSLLDIDTSDMISTLSHTHIAASSKLHTTPPVLEVYDDDGTVGLRSSASEDIALLENRKSRAATP